MPFEHHISDSLEKAKMYREFVGLDPNVPHTQTNKQTKTKPTKLFMNTKTLLSCSPKSLAAFDYCELPRVH